ncbi:MAG: TonB-dependent receptor [Chlorobi bacterium]|nr:TonB-dependent receptor [Chlorobiota bacterium]
MKIYFFLIIFFTVTFKLNSQIVKGTVFQIDKDGLNSPLPGATIKLLNTKIGSISNSNGQFQIDLKFADTNKLLVVSFIGFESDTTLLDGMLNDYEITLEPLITNSKEVQITAEKSAQSVGLKTLKQEFITGKLFRRSACCALSEAFEKNASAEVAYSDALTGVKQIKLLGLKGEYSYLLTETIPIFSGLTSKYALEYTPPTWLEGISITKGASSVSSGYEGITGQINLEYKKPFDMSPFEGNVYVNSSNRIDLNLSSAIKVNEKLSTGIFVSGRNSNLKEDHNNDGFIDVPLNKQINIANRWIYVTDGFEAQLFARGLNDEYNSGQVNFIDKISTPLNYGSSTKISRYEFFTKMAKLETETDHLSLALILSGSTDSISSFSGLKSFDTKEDKFNAKFILKSEIGIHEEDYYTFGMSYLYRNQIGNYNEKVNKFKIDEKESVVGLFAELNYKPFDQISFIAGIRADQHNNYGTLLTPRFHLKYDLSDLFKVRFSLGYGYHAASVIGENPNVLSSARLLKINNLEIESAVNIGSSINTTLELFEIPFIFDLDFYSTNFVNQVIADYDSSIDSIIFKNVKNESYTNNYQAQVSFNLIPELELAFAYRYNDIKSIFGNEKLIQPLQSPGRILVTGSYLSHKKDFQFDGTLIWNSSGRLPNFIYSHETNENTFKNFFRFNLQVTKKFGELEFYIGGENLSNFTQHQPIIESSNPFSDKFDASMIWGPLEGRMFYFGSRFKL